MWSIAESKTVRCTRGLAKEYAAMTPAPGDRDVRDSILNHIRTAVLASSFRSAQFASVYCHETSTNYRLNGKHTSLVLSSMNGEFPKDLTVHVEKYEADTLQDVAQLYATFDRRGSARSTGDINKSFAATDKDLADINSRIINLGVSGIYLAQHGADSVNTASKRLSPEERAAAMFKYPKFFIWLDSIGLNDTDGRHLRRAPVVAAMFLTFLKSREASTEFWGLVKDGSGKDHTSGDRVLNKYLLTHSIRGTGFQDKRSNTDSSRAMHVRCLHAWNAWRSGTTTTMKYHESSPVPAAK